MKVQIKDESTPVRDVNTQYRCPALRKSGISVSPIWHPAYKAKMEKRLGVTLKQSYVNKITAMLNSGTIPPGNSGIIHRFLLRKTRPRSEIRTWKNQNWDGYCKQCCKLIETTAHIFECEKTEPTWMLSASTQDYTEYTTSRACWETTTFGQTTKRGARY